MELRGNPPGHRDPFKPLEEVHVEESAAELPIGDPLEADRFLSLHDLADRLVLDATEVVLTDLIFLESIARVFQVFRPEEAADMVGAERGMQS
jgi:hypothetical protein